MGYFIFLTNSRMDINPLHWKSCVIDKVAKDIKTAKTIALEPAIDDAIHLKNLLMEIYSGKVKEYSIPIIVNEDSLSLVKSIYSTKKVKRKTMRVVVAIVRQHLKRKRISDIKHGEMTFLQRKVCPKK